MREDLGTISNFRVEVHLLETALDEVKEEVVLCAQDHRQKPPGLLSAVSLTCINITQHQQTTSTDIHNNQEAKDIQ